MVVKQYKTTAYRRNKDQRYTRSVHKVSNHVIWKIATFIEEDTETLYIEQWHFSPLQRGHLRTSCSSPSRHQLPRRVFLNLINSLKSLLFQKWFYILGKAIRRKAPNLGCRGSESPGWFDVSLKSSAGDMMHEQCVVVMKLPITSCPWPRPSESSQWFFAKEC